jgi:hypothetical protein
MSLIAARHCRLKRALDIHNQTLLAAKALADSPFLTANLAHHRAGFPFVKKFALISRLRGQEAWQ